LSSDSNSESSASLAPLYFVRWRSQTDTVGVLHNSWCFWGVPLGGGHSPPPRPPVFGNKGQ
jgi:hypothetical protein